MSKINITNFTIDGRSVTANHGETILNVARREGIYIPTMCYIEKTTPCASCRLCSVEAVGVDGFVLSCNTPPTEGIEIVTNSDSLQTERTNIMKLYDVNHPLECGVCDKSGECDLQNKTLEFDVSQQNFTARDQERSIENWGLINYNPSLCILCEKCTHVCNEVIGDDAIDLQFGGYKSKVVPKDSDILDCTFCGECIAVCPVGALVSSEFQYSANAWELSKIPATCAHCSAGCSLEYEVKTVGAATAGQSEIMRVTNNFEFTSLCGAGRFGFDFDKRDVKDVNEFNKAIEKFKSANAIKFTSMVTNEEAMILNALKEKLGLKLFNEEARNYQKFMRAYSKVSGKLHHSATLDAVKQSDAAIVIGSRISTDNPGVRYALTTASRHNGAKVIYLHPMEDALMQNVVTQMIRYEVGTEEGVLALIAKALLTEADLDETSQNFLNSLDDGYLCAESNVGEEELEMIQKSLRRTKNRVIILGNDVINHDRAENIARIAALIEEYTDFSLLIVPSEVNTLGVSLICDLDEETSVNSVVGYNAKADYTVASFGEADLNVAALNQQEGTFVSVDNQVLPTNVAIAYEGYTLNEIAGALGVEAEYSIDYTPQLPQTSGFKATAFDDLENFLTHDGKDVRGYILDNVNREKSVKFEQIADLPEFNGTVIYSSNPVLQFNPYTADAKQLESDISLRGSAQFAAAARIADGDEVEIQTSLSSVIRVFKLDAELKGTVALNPNFDLGLERTLGSYRYEIAKINRVSN